MNDDFWKKLNMETIAEIILIVKIGLVVFIKKWIELFSETAYRTLKKHKGWMLIPALILQFWFPMAALIDLSLIKQYGVWAILWACVDIYMACFLWNLMWTFLRQLRAKVNT